MKYLKKYIILILFVAVSSCSDFLDTAPLDALSPSTTWKNENDAQKFAIGCYDGWEDGEIILYLDCNTDFGYNNFEWENYKTIANGTMSPSGNVKDFYDYNIIRRCNTFLEKVQDISFADEQVRTDLIGQIRTIRAYRYFVMNWWYGGIPIIDNYSTADEAKVPRKTEAEVIAFVNSELDAAIEELNAAPAERGRIAKGVAMAIRMRSALYYNDFQKAKEMSEAIIGLDQYSLESDYNNLFTVSGQGSKEIIAAVQYVNVTKTLYAIGQMYNNADGGWSSIVPTQNLVNTYEMKDGLTKEESSLYDPVHPFANRDPRMGMTILYPGMDWRGGIINTLDKTVDGAANVNYPPSANNASKTALTWRKYLDPMDQYTGGIFASNACPIVIRYAEVLLTYAEAANELAGPSADIYDKLDEVRMRVGMPTVDRSKYGTKETLRQIIRRERSVEFAGEGVRRPDIMRWKDSNGDMLAETVLNQTLERVVGTINYSETNPTKRAVIDVNASESDKKIEDRVFSTFNRYNPIPQAAIDNNPKLEQNEGYVN
ncbi:MAG: RagB/SusD family nutrient uptake outer membrane protein [Bacteroidales bacterium]